MMERSLLRHCLSMIESASSVDELQSVITHTRDCYRLSHLVFHVVRLGASRIDHPLILPTYTIDWINYYFDKNFFALDPVLEVSRIGFLPVDWSSLDHASSTTSHFFRQADSYGVGRFGVTIPVRGPRGERSLLTATSNLRENQWTNLRADCMMDLQIISYQLHEKALTVSGLRKKTMMRDLSRRELQCIDLVSQGRLPKQIAAQLQISESTVRLHLRSAKRKLGGATTTQAIGRAVALELIRG